ncbi:alpha-amylase family glycosyl hydrolase [Gracilimonas sp.]|uniref:alpha-amylase family glycosyl hydrolase n=1 Tax=Gracilimonas sp. TaxID=1974203 RepID=UPI002872A3F4|nr:alpha-amylase family glycosyl hydrolase [Gracilimonas sp.]
MRSSKFLPLLFLLFLSNSLWAQIITTEPSFPTENSEVTIVYDATEGNGELEGFSGDVYLHTGLITDNSSNGGVWKYVPYGWTVNDESMKATPLGDDKWGFTYSPSVRDFFGVSSGEEVEQIAIVFKGVQNGEIVREGKDTGGSDIFIDLFTGETNAQFLSPDKEFVILNDNESFELEGAGSTNAGTLSLTLFKNGNEVLSDTSETLTYNFTPTESDTDVTFDLVADNGQNVTDTASVFFTVVDENKSETPRPEGLEDGITRNADGSVTLSLFAPSKEYVHVIGSFNDWTPKSDYLMNIEHHGSDSTWFWIELDDLEAGDHAFQYLVDGEVRVSDPYSELILDPFNDQYITDNTFPDLMPYPSEETEGWVTYLREEQDYTWEASDYQRPDKEELVIYELLLRDFLNENNFQTLTDSLNYLENLGVNAIELMPVSEFDGNLSWGYNPNHHLALDKAYGTPETFKRFVDEAHKRGMAVILDVVMNHASDPNPFFQLYGNDDSYYFNSQARHAYNVFNDFDHSYSGTQYYNKRMIEHWIDEYKIDGFRWDLTKGFTQNCSGDSGGCTNAPQTDRIKVLKKYADYQWAADEDFIVIFEHLGQESEEAQWANYRVDEGKGIMLWGNMNHPYSEATMGYHDGGKSNLYGVLSESRSSFEKRYLVGYMESHDEQWLMLKNRKFGNSSGDYDITDLETALGRQKLAGAFFFTLPGPKMIWQFGELGYGYGDNGEQCLNESPDCPSFAPGRTAEKPIRWEYFQDEERLKLYKTWKELIRLRKSSPVFTDPVSASYSLSGSTKTFTLEHDDATVVAVGNFGVTETTVDVNFTNSGEWFDFFSGTSVNVSGADFDLNLDPGEFKIYSTKDFGSPDEELVTSNEEFSNGNIPTEFQLKQNYPNPFNPSTVISYQLAGGSEVSLKVYDMLGREVATLVNERKSAGSYQVHFDASNLSSSMYIYRLQAGGKVFTQKMMLIK